VIKKTLIIPDAHSNPDSNNDRFSWIGNFILEEVPELVLCIGDFADLNSLSSYDKGKRSAELRRYRHDIRAARDALLRINEPLHTYNVGRKSSKKAPRREPRKIITLGNHEHRIERAINNAPELDGTLHIDDIGFQEFGWEVSPFKRPVVVEGVHFCHYFPSGVKGEAISGFNIASSIVVKNMVSSVCGHSHLYDHAVRHRPDGHTVIGLCVGWYGETPGYEDATDNLWWSGLVVLHDMTEGRFDVEQIGYERVRALYS
jgi:hypothetical protein